MSEESDHQTITPGTIPPKGGQRDRGWLLEVALLVVLGGAAYWVLRAIQEPELPFAHDSRFVATKVPPTGIRHYPVPRVQ